MTLPGDTAIRVAGLGKRYRIGAVRRRTDTFRDVVTEGSIRALQRLKAPRSRSAHPDESFWALQDVTFALPRGEVLGVIGANGAGKSTLLKILSRITEPTLGEAEICGRVGSLLEVGTGFHTELTGRENIFLSGAMLGMRRSEIESKLDEIVAFAEVERFLDTPVKHYSSGMYLRLAFAVAAHLEPEILIVDEVLAVGDASFQQKCLGKMENVAGAGRTVLFVSHNMNAIRNLCSRCIMLEAGRVTADGHPDEVITGYLGNVRRDTTPNSWIDLGRGQRSGTGELRFAAVRYQGSESEFGGHLYADGPAEFLCAIESETRRTVGSIAVTLSTSEGERLVNMDCGLQGRAVELLPGLNIVRVATPSLHLHAGMYKVALWMANPAANSAYDYLPAALHVEIADMRSSSLVASPYALVTCDFEVTRVESPAAEPYVPDRAAG